MVKQLSRTQKNIRATSYDVAERAGVSQSAVSRCFKPGASVSKKMRDRVMKAARELHYQPNAIARGLITRKSNLIAIIVSPELSFYYPEVLFQLTDRLAAKNLRVLLFTASEKADVEKRLDQIWQYQVDGVISVVRLSVEHSKILERRNIPVVMFNCYFETHPSNNIWCDPSRATQEMISHLMDLGHRKYALLQGPEQSMVNRQRMNAVRTALEKYKIRPVCEAWGNYRYESAAKAVKYFLKAKPKPTVIISANDMMAMGAMDEVRTVLGLSIPEDISVVGFDGVGAGRFASYDLMTIRQPIGRMSDAAISILLDRIEDPSLSVEKRILEGMLLSGTSAGPAPDVRK